MCNDYKQFKSHIWVLYKICFRCVFKIVLRLKIPNMRFGKKFLLKNETLNVYNNIKVELKHFELLGILYKG